MSAAIVSGTAPLVRRDGARRPAARAPRPSPRRRFAAAALAAIGLALAAAAPAAAQRTVTLSSVPRAWLGFSYVTAERSTDGAKKPRPGVEVQRVEEDSPAARAGLRVGDRILSVNGIKATPQLLGSLSSSLDPGDAVRLRIEREGHQSDVQVTAAAPPDWLKRRQTVVILDGDSIRQQVRVFLDSARTAVERIRIPRIEVLTDSGSAWTLNLDGDTVLVRSGARLRLFADSAFGGGFGPTVFRWSGPDSTLLRAGRAQWIDVDSSGRNFVWAGPNAFVFRNGATDSTFDFTTPADLLNLQIRTGMHSVAGAEFAVVNPDLGAYFGVDTGVLVTRVSRTSPAARAGLRAGDIVVKAGGRPVQDVSDLRAAVRRAASKPLEIEIVRRKEHRTLTLPRD